LILPSIHWKVETGNHSVSFSCYFLFQIKSKYEDEKNVCACTFDYALPNNKKIVSRILVRNMKLENKITAELLHHPLYFISFHSMELPFLYTLVHFAYGNKMYVYTLPVQNKVYCTSCFRFPLETLIEKRELFIH
jgi:hypothetical protein